MKPIEFLRKRHDLRGALYGATFSLLLWGAVLSDFAEEGTPLGTLVGITGHISTLFLAGAASFHTAALSCPVVERCAQWGLSPSYPFAPAWTQDGVAGFCGRIVTEPLASCQMQHLTFWAVGFAALLLAFHATIGALIVSSYNARKKPAKK